jgi:hypothetical protein
VRSLNLSYEGLTSYSIRETLRQLKNTRPEFWKELDDGRQDEPTNLEATALEDQQTNVQHETAPEDDSAVSIHQLAAKTVLCIVAGGAKCVEDQASGIVAVGEAKSLDFRRGDTPLNEVEEELGRGKRKRKANTLYSHSFWLSHDD